MRSLLFLIIIPFINIAQQSELTIQGLVTSKKTKAAIPYAQIYIADSIISTDEKGSFKIKLKNETQIHLLTFHFETRQDSTGKEVPKYLPKIDTLHNPNLDGFIALDIELTHNSNNSKLAKPGEQYVIGQLVERGRKKIINNASITITGSDGSSREQISNTGSYAFRISPKTTYQIQGDPSSLDTICGIKYRKYFASEKALVSTLYNNQNSVLFQNLMVDPILSCYRIDFPSIRVIEGELLPQNKIRLNGLVEIMKNNPTITFCIKHVKAPITAGLIKNYLVSKGVNIKRLELKEMNGFKLDCFLVDRNKDYYPDLKTGFEITPESIKLLNTKTQEFLKPYLDHNVSFEIKSTNFKP